MTDFGLLFKPLAPAAGSFAFIMTLVFFRNLFHQLFIVLIDFKLHLVNTKKLHHEADPKKYGQCRQDKKDKGFNSAFNGAEKAHKESVGEYLLQREERCAGKSAIITHPFVFGAFLFPAEDCFCFPLCSPPLFPYCTIN